MQNEARMIPFPKNLFHDIGIDEQTEQADDFFATLMYVLRCVTTARDSRLILMRYKDGKTFDEIGDALEISKQRANALTQSILDKITGDYAMMLAKGIKRYYEDLFNDRLADMQDVLEESEKQRLKHDSYADGYKAGYNDGLVEKQSNGVNMDVLHSIYISTVSMSFRLYHALDFNGVKTLGDAMKIGDHLIHCRLFGATCFRELADVLTSYGVNVKEVFPKACKKFKWGN